MQNFNGPGFTDAHSAIAPAPAARARKTVLVVVEDPFVRELIALNLRAAGCFPMAVASVDEGKRLAAQVTPDLIVIDVDSDLGQGSAWVLQQVRSSVGRALHIAMLSSDPTPACAIDGSHCGACLCVAKPFQPRELNRQLLQLLQSPRTGERRKQTRAPLKTSSIELEREQPTLRLRLPDGWHTLDLPWTEHRLLVCLLTAGDRARSREDIRDEVWRDTPVDLRTVDQYVRRLRASLEGAGAKDIVRTVKGMGYQLDLGALKRAPE